MDTRTRTLLGLLPMALTACITTMVILSMTRTTDDLAEVAADAYALAEQAGTDKVLVVFDIDNTLLAMDHGLGSDQWYEWQKELAEENPCHPQIAGQRFAVQGALYYASAMHATQPDGPARVAELQEAGFTVIALTSRGVNYRLQTFRELRRNGYSFAYSGMGPAGGLDGDFTPPSGTRAARYEDGVFLTSGQHKGDMLKDLLTLTGTDMPAVIVMVDDKQSNLDAVTETFEPLGIPVHAWHYIREQPNVAAFDPDAADELWQELEPHLRAIQEMLGPDHYLLPAQTGPDICRGEMLSQPE